MLYLLLVKLAKLVLCTFIFSKWTANPEFIIKKYGTIGAFFNFLNHFYIYCFVLMAIILIVLPLFRWKQKWPLWGAGITILTIIWFPPFNWIIWIFRDIGIEIGKTTTNYFLTGAVLITIIALIVVYLRKGDKVDTLDCPSAQSAGKCQR